LNIIKQVWLIWIEYCWNSTTLYFYVLYILYKSKWSTFGCLYHPIVRVGDGFWIFSKCPCYDHSNKGCHHWFYSGKVGELEPFNVYGFSFFVPCKTLIGNKEGKCKLFQKIISVCLA
jgi:hypothetical protein